jgi:hypothetical protein
VWALECKEIVEHLRELQEEGSGVRLANLIETMPHVDLTWVVDSGQSGMLEKSYR